jgi:hypothetical protein
LLYVIALRQSVSSSRSCRYTALICV